MLSRLLLAALLLLLLQKICLHLCLFSCFCGNDHDWHRLGGLLAVQASYMCCRGFAAVQHPLQRLCSIRQQHGFQCCLHREVQLLEHLSYVNRTSWRWCGWLLAGQTLAPQDGVLLLLLLLHRSSNQTQHAVQLV